MTIENNYASRNFSLKSEKKTWMKPAITTIEQEKIRQEEVELYYRMMEDPELFKLIGNSGSDAG